jgi:hypothetical protein
MAGTTVDMVASASSSMAASVPYGVIDWEILTLMLVCGVVLLLLLGLLSYVLRGRRRPRYLPLFPQ